MKIKCENVIVCGNYNCVWNCGGRCGGQDVIALDGSGKCVLAKPKPVPKDTTVAPNKSKPIFDMETSK